MGAESEVEKNWLLDAVKSSGAVSPATRATASMTPVSRPDAAAGRITLQATRHRGAPSPSAASFIWLGTSRSISSAVRTTMGNISTARATPPGEGREVLLHHHDAQEHGHADDDRGHARAARRR